MMLPPWNISVTVCLALNVYRIDKEMTEVSQIFQCRRGMGKFIQLQRRLVIKHLYYG